MTSIPNNTNKLPSVESEIKIHEKKMLVISQLEELAAGTSVVLKEALVNCPFGHDTLELQQLINAMTSSNLTFTQALNILRNATVETHFNTMDLLLENEKITEDNKTENLEDKFAAYKSNLVPELTASSHVRSLDAQLEVDFNKKLENLTNLFLNTEKSTSAESTSNVE